MQDAREDEKSEAAGRAAERGREGEKYDAGDEKTFSAEEISEPVGRRENDRVGHEIAGQDPGRFVRRRGRLPAMCGSETFATEVSSTSMKVASMTDAAISHGLWLGCQSCAAAAGESAATSS